MNRFYKTVSLTQVDHGFHICLDGKPVKTPGRVALSAPNESLANAIMREWMEQGEEIIPDSMPLTQILSTKIDRVSIERAAMTQMVLKFLDTDLVCYRTDIPPALKAAQEEAWNPALEWFAQTYDVALETTYGLSALTQNPDAHAAVSQTVTALDDDHFTILQLLTSATGSLILSLMALDGQMDADDLFNAIRVEEQYQAKIYDEEKYGPEPHQEKKDKALQKDLKAAEIYLKTL